MTPNLPVESILAAKFSLPFMIAARLLLGDTGPDIFTPQVPFDAGIRALSRRVEITEDAELTARGAASRGARVEIVLKNGLTLLGEVAHSLGDPARPLERDAIVEKFRRLVHPRLGDARGRQLEAAIFSLPALDDCSGIAAALAR
jgi:2-methylcitrate dehydratase PrpD